MLQHEFSILEDILSSAQLYLFLNKKIPTPPKIYLTLNLFQLYSINKIVSGEVMRIQIIMMRGSEGIQALMRFILMNDETNIKYLSSFSRVCKFWDIFNSFSLFVCFNACLHKWPITYRYQNMQVLNVRVVMCYQLAQLKNIGKVLFLYSETL